MKPLLSSLAAQPISAVLSYMYGGGRESELWLPVCLTLGPGACQCTFSIMTVSLIPFRTEVIASGVCLVPADHDYAGLTLCREDTCTFSGTRQRTEPGGETVG